jgi:tetratricopeptide (TPR) repeat protein
MTHASLRTTMILALTAILAPHLFAQTGTTPAESNPSSTGANGSIASGKDTSPLNSMNTMNMAAPREASAFKTLQQIPDTDFDKKIKAGDEFIKKYNNSTLLPAVYGILAVTYIQGGQPQKGYAAGEKALALQPNDMRTLANLAQSMARLANPSDPNAAQDLQKAKDYAQRCIQTTPKLLKPEGASEEEYNTYNTQNLAMAHGALGTVLIRQGKFAEAITELQQSVQIGGAKDATNLYLLGVASQNSQHYPEALDAFNKCLAANPGNLQKACTDGAAAAKSHVK